MEGSRANGASSFTHNGDYFALLSVDGRLRIWDTTSGKVVQEFSSTSAAQSSCTCLCWTRRTFSRRAKKKLKRKEKKGDDDVVPLLSSLAIGTEKGFLFCYNPTTSEIENINKEGHNAKVNCIVYQEENDIIYTCSDDKYIIEWCEGGKQQIKSKWKADEQAVKRICLSPSGTALLSAGCSIKLWDLNTKDLLQKFHGHASPVSFLQFSPFRQKVNAGSIDDGCYFVSASTEDRVINAWQVNSKSPEVMAIASFIISDVASFMDIILDEDDDKPLKLCVGCTDGRIHFFTCTMNGRTLRPIESSKTVDYIMKEGASTRPIPFINARLNKNSSDVQLNLVSGQTIKPSFTTLNYAALDVASKIEKDVPKNLLLSEITPEKDTSIELATTSSCAKVIADAVSVPIPVTFDKNVESLPSTVEVEMNGEEEKTDSSKDELSMEERMKLQEPGAQEFVVKMKQKKDAPNAGSFAQLVIQALHSHDDKLLSNILYSTRVQPTVLLNTIKRIPNNLVDSLLKTLSKELLWNPNRSKYLIDWLKTVVTVHLTFLLTSDVSREALSGLYRFVKSQEEIHLPLLSLQGKIDMLCAYVSGNSVDDGDEEDVSTAAVIYNDDSDDETEELWREIGKTEADVKTVIDVGASEDDLKIDTDDNNETGTDAEEAMSSQSEIESDEEV